MPELPEVETIRSDLEKKIRGKTIRKTKINKEKMVGGNPAVFSRHVEGKKVLAVKRRGKLLIIHLDSGEYLLLHLKMTGQLIYTEKGKFIAGGHSQGEKIKELPNKYSHLIFYFDDASVLYFNDMRQFGYARVVGDDELSSVVAKYGIEPLTPDFRFEDFKDIFNKRTTSVKAVLLNQQLVSGIGNIYADEILFAAGVRPARTAKSLNLDEKTRIFRQTERIIREAIKYRGTTFNDYVDADGNQGGFVKRLKVFGREGKKCRKCRTGVIKKTRVAQRGTHYCEKCQK